MKDKVNDDVMREKARELSRAGGRAGGGFRERLRKAAKAAGLEVKTSELVARGTALPDVGISPAVDAAVFAHRRRRHGPIVTDAATVIAHVVEHQDTKPEEMATARDGLRTELLNEQRSRFFGAYMQKAREQLKAETSTRTRCDAWLGSRGDKSGSG